MHGFKIQPPLNCAPWRVPCLEALARLLCSTVIKKAAGCAQASLMGPSLDGCLGCWPLPEGSLVCRDGFPPETYSVLSHLYSNVQLYAESIINQRRARVYFGGFLPLSSQIWVPVTSHGDRRRNNLSIKIHPFRGLAPPTCPLLYLISSQII